MRVKLDEVARKIETDSSSYSRTLALCVKMGMEDIRESERIPKTP